MKTSILLLVAFSLTACVRTPDEQRIRQTIATMQQAVEAGAPRDFIAHVSADFSGDRGSVDREGLHNLLRVQVLQNEHVNVLLGPIEVELQGERATAKLTATLTGRGASRLPERLTVLSITSSWRRAGSAWECYNAQWEQKF